MAIPVEMHCNYTTRYRNVLYYRYNTVSVKTIFSIHTCPIGLTAMGVCVVRRAEINARTSASRSVRGAVCVWRSLGERSRAHGY